MLLISILFGDDLGSRRTSNQWRDAQIRTSSGSTDELESRKSDLIENCWSGQISQCTYCTWSIYGIRCTVIYSLRFTVRPMNINVSGTTWYVLCTRPIYSLCIQCTSTSTCRVGHRQNMKREEQLSDVRVPSPLGKSSIIPDGSRHPVTS